MQTSRRDRIKEIAQRLAGGTASPEATRELRKLLDDLAQDSDIESLPEITQFIRQHLEAGPLEEGEAPLPIPPPTPAEPQPEEKAGYAPPKAVMVGGAAVALLVVVFLVARLLLPSAGSESTSGAIGDQTPALGEATAVTLETEEPMQSAQVDATPTPARSAAATPTRETPTPSPSPTPAKQEYTILACVGWQDDPEVGLPGSTIIWGTGSDPSTQKDAAASAVAEAAISDEDGCVEFPVNAAPDTQIRLWAKLPDDETNLQIVGYDASNDDRSLAWEVVEEEQVFALATTLGEETSGEYLARFLVVAQRTFSGEVLNEEGNGIPGTEALLWSRASPGENWNPINQTTIADPDGTFVLTGTTGLPELFYRVGISDTIANSYVYTTTSATGPDANWVAGQDPGTPSVAWVETRTALDSGQLSVEDIVFNQDLEYVVLRVEEAILEPEGLDWQTVSPSLGQDETKSKLITIDQSNVDGLQARWEDVELLPGTYALEIWTPENSSARVSYHVSSPSQLLDERVSYQSTRQDRGEVDQWIDFSRTLNPSLVIELPTSGRVTVIAEPSLSTTNREYNLGGNVVFGVGPVRFVKQ